MSFNKLTQRLISAYWQNIRRVWEGKDVLIVRGQTPDQNQKYNVYDNARNIEYVYGPSKNAFDTYDSLLPAVTQKADGKLVIIQLGPTATVMAYDLHNLGFRALDLGHLGKSYDWFRRGRSIAKSTENFMTS